MTRKLTISLKPQHAIELTRIAVGSQRLVYVLLANKKLKYEHGRKSAIAYIGTSKNGASRVASSATYWAEEILGVHGITKVTARIVTCRPRRAVKSWVKLERALLLQFREMYGSIPRWNTQGKRITEADEFEYFARDRVRNILATLG